MERSKKITYGTRLRRAFADIQGGIAKQHLWRALAWEDLKQTYKRSVFGLFWIAISFAAFIGIKMVVFIPLMSGQGQNEHEYTVYLTLGFFTFNYISMIISNAPSVFTKMEGFIKNDPLPLTLYVMKTTTLSLVNFSMMGLVAFAVVGYAQGGWTWNVIWLFPVLIIYLLNSLWVNLLLGIICTRYRDISHLISTIMRFMFFMVPVFWRPEDLPGLWNYLKWNPLAHFMIILRDPIMGNGVPVESWIIVGTTTIVGFLIAIPIFAAFRHRVVFWF